MNFINRYEEKPIYKDRKYLLVLVFFIIIFGLIAYTIYVDGNSKDLKFETTFSGKVENIFNQKSTYYIKLSTEEKWIKLNDFKNENYPELDFYFMDIVQEGDVLLKKSNSDTIELIKLKKKYYFKFEKYLD